GAGAGRVLSPTGAVAGGLRPGARRCGGAERASDTFGRGAGRAARAAAPGGAAALLRGPLPPGDRAAAEALAGRRRLAPAPGPLPPPRANGKRSRTVRHDREAAARQQQLDEVIAEYLEAVDAGQTLNPDEWLARFPDLAEPLANFFAEEGWVHGLLAVR